MRGERDAAQVRWLGAHAREGRDHEHPADRRRALEGVAEGRVVDQAPVEPPEGPPAVVDRHRGVRAWHGGGCRRGHEDALERLGRVEVGAREVDDVLEGGRLDAVDRDQLAVDVGDDEAQVDGRPGSRRRQDVAPQQSNEPVVRRQAEPLDQIPQAQGEHAAEARVVQPHLRHPLADEGLRPRADGRSVVDPVESAGARADDPGDVDAEAGLGRGVREDGQRAGGERPLRPPPASTRASDIQQPSVVRRSRRSSPG